MSSDCRVIHYVIRLTLSMLLLSQVSITSTQVTDRLNLPAITGKPPFNVSLMSNETSIMRSLFLNSMQNLVSDPTQAIRYHECFSGTSCSPYVFPGDLQHILSRHPEDQGPPLPDSQSSFFISGYSPVYQIEFLNVIPGKMGNYSQDCRVYGSLLAAATLKVCITDIMEGIITGISLFVWPWS